jgi:acyl carrier protein
MNDQVRAFIKNNFYVSNDTELSDDMSLLDHGIVDSTGALEIVAFLERTFGIHIDDDELLPENLDSIDKIVVFVGRKQAG